MSIFESYIFSWPKQYDPDKPETWSIAEIKKHLTGYAASTELGAMTDEEFTRLTTELRRRAEATKAIGDTIKSDLAEIKKTGGSPIHYKKSAEWVSAWGTMNPKDVESFIAKIEKKRKEVLKANKVNSPKAAKASAPSAPPAPTPEAAPAPKPPPKTVVPDLTEGLPEKIPAAAPAIPEENKIAKAAVEAKNSFKPELKELQNVYDDYLDAWNKKQNLTIYIGSDITDKAEPTMKREGSVLSTLSFKSLGLDGITDPTRPTKGVTFRTPILGKTIQAEKGTLTVAEFLRDLSNANFVQFGVAENSNGIRPLSEKTVAKLADLHEIAPAMGDKEFSISKILSNLIDIGTDKKYLETFQMKYPVYEITALTHGGPDGISLSPVDHLTLAKDGGVKAEIAEKVEKDAGAIAEKFLETKYGKYAIPAAAVGLGGLGIGAGFLIDKKRRDDEAYIREATARNYGPPAMDPYTSSYWAEWKHPRGAGGKFARKNFNQPVDAVQAVAEQPQQVVGASNGAPYRYRDDIANAYLFETPELEIAPKGPLFTGLPTKNSFGTFGNLNPATQKRLHDAIVDAFDKVAKTSKDAGIRNEAGAMRDDIKLKAPSWILEASPEDIFRSAGKVRKPFEAALNNNTVFQNIMGVDNSIMGKASEFLKSPALKKYGVPALIGAGVIGAGALGWHYLTKKPEIPAAPSYPGAYGYSEGIAGSYLLANCPSVDSVHIDGTSNLSKKLKKKGLRLEKPISAAPAITQNPDVKPEDSRELTEAIPEPMLAKFKRIIKEDYPAYKPAVDTAGLGIAGTALYMSNKHYRREAEEDAKARKQKRAGSTAAVAASYKYAEDDSESGGISSMLRKRGYFPKKVWADNGQERREKETELTKNILALPWLIHGLEILGIMKANADSANSQRADTRQSRNTAEILNALRQSNIYKGTPSYGYIGDDSETPVELSEKPSLVNEIGQGVDSSLQGMITPASVGATLGGIGAAALIGHLAPANSIFSNLVRKRFATLEGKGISEARRIAEIQHAQNQIRAARGADLIFAGSSILPGAALGSGVGTGIQSYLDKKKSY